MQRLTVPPYSELQPWLQEPQAWIPALPGPTGNLFPSFLPFLSSMSSLN